MREPRNPFHLRASEQIESDATFLRLFGPGVLDLLPQDGLWDRVQIFRSAPGGGKTSLLRLFTPASLLTLHSYRSGEDYKELYQRLKGLGAISDDGPQILGIMLSCARNYATFEDLAFDQHQQERLLHALLNARLILATLRGALALKRLEYPRDLDRLVIRPPRHAELPSTLPGAGPARALYDWACSVEKRVCETLDSFSPVTGIPIRGQDTLHALSFLRPDGILCDGRPITGQLLVMIDDVHKLTPGQRRKLLETLFDLRAPVGVWLAERLEALSPDEVLAPGATTGREYGEPINLEEFWRPGGNARRFEPVVINIADRRVKSAQDIEVGPFAGYLHDTLDGAEWQAAFERACATVAERVRKRVGAAARYQDWVRAIEFVEGTPRERTLAWRALEIIIERDLRKSQLVLFPDLVLAPEELGRKDDSEVRGAAEFFLAHEFGIPYYFGSSRLANLASCNIEQFLALAGDLFEEILALELLGRHGVLRPERQEAILKKAVRRRWEEIPRRIPNGRDVWALLEAIRQCARWETDRPNAPYAPGVTGIALTMADRARLADPSVRKRRPEYERLARALSSCIAHNLLEASIDRSQGQKGKTWMVLYLNRLLCLQFELPLQYGGWRPKTPDELCRWLDHGFRPPKNGGSSLL